MKRLAVLSFGLLLLCLSCTKEDGTFSEHSVPTRLSDYIFEITYDAYSPVIGEKYLKTLERVSRGGACTVVRNGSLVGRNFDYFYSDMAEFVIHVPATRDRYASIGVATSVFELTPDRVMKDPYGQYFEILPYVTMDGMNEKGLFCCVNMVTRENGYVTVGTNPGADQTLYASSVVRFLLDNCSSVDQACKMLADRNIVFIEALGEYHFLMADREQTVVAEIMDNKLVCKRPKADVLTNFYVLTDSFLENDDPGLLPSGLERYEYAVSHLSDANSVDNTAQLLESVKYSRLYDLQTSPYWYSDFYGYRCDGKTIDASTPKEEYTRFIEHKCELFASRRRDYTQAFWITTHSSVYDLENLTLRLYVQEDFTNYFDFVLR